LIIGSSPQPELLALSISRCAGQRKGFDEELAIQAPFLSAASRVAGSRPVWGQPKRAADEWDFKNPAKGFVKVLSYRATLA
jgi:hypothetical protein